MTTRLMRLAMSTGLAAVVLFSAACGSSTRGPYASTGETVRDPVKAEASYRQAIAVLESDPKEAEECLRAALGFDLYHGAAHNNLGVLLLKQDRLYDAAEEFEWARKLMPGHPEPRINLAITLDRGGKHVDAIEAAKTALEIAPGNLAAMQVVALVQVREGLADGETKGRLDDIVQRSTDPAWRVWAETARLGNGASAH